MNSLKNLIQFLYELDEKKIFYTLSKIRDSILVTVAVPGERWEIEFMENGTIEIEKFKSNGEIYDQKELELLYQEYAE